MSRLLFNVHFLLLSIYTCLFLLIASYLSLAQKKSQRFFFSLSSLSTRLFQTLSLLLWNQIGISTPSSEAAPLLHLPRPPPRPYPPPHLVLGFLPHLLLPAASSLFTTLLYKKAKLCPLRRTSMEQGLPLKSFTSFASLSSSNHSLTPSKLLLLSLPFLIHQCPNHLVSSKNRSSLPNQVLPRPQNRKKG